MNTFVPGFQHDLFISYAHRDDLTWVAAFEKSLRESLGQRLGHDISVWQDTKSIRAGANWDDAIKTAIRQSAVVVAIISPSYENSDWCTDERNEFAEQFKTTGGLESSNRFFVAVKTPWEKQLHRLFLRKIHQVLFFRPGDDSTGEHEFVPGTDDFKFSVRALAAGIADSLRQLRRQRERVFLASPQDQCVPVWRQLSRELIALNYDVQPPARRDAAFADELLQNEMLNAKLSVHLLGSAYDPFTERQILLAADGDHRLLFWTGAAGSNATLDPQQAALVSSIKSGMRPGSTSVPLPDGWTLLSDKSPRKLIDEVLTALRPSTQASTDTTDGPNVYIIQDATTEEDTRVAQRLRDELVTQRGLTVSIARSDLGSLAAVQERHERMMKTCDSALLYRSAAPESWLRQLAPEVILAEQLLKRQPMRSKAFLLPDTSGWNALPNLDVISYSSEFQLTDLDPFLKRLRPDTHA